MAGIPPIPRSLTKSELAGMASKIIGELEDLGDGGRETIFEIIGIAFPKSNGMQRLKKNNEEDNRIIKGEIPKISGGPKLPGY